MKNNAIENRKSNIENIGKFRRRGNAVGIREVEPWHEAVDGKLLLDELAGVFRRFVILPRHAAETLALWVVHSYGFELRDVATYIGIESPEKRCGKTTLLAVLSELVCRPVVAANISSPAFFRVIEELRPTLLIDEADTFLHGNEELRGILNSGYARSTARVIRVANEVRGKGISESESESERLLSPALSSSAGGEGEDEGNGRSKIEDRKHFSHEDSGSRLASFSCWCPKVMAAIGRLPDTLADRCIVIRMHRKSVGESCERLRLLDAEVLRRKCARFVLDHRDAITLARPAVPEELNDRAADVWEPLFVIADLVGGTREGTDGRGFLTGGNEGNGEEGTEGTEGTKAERIGESGTEERTSNIQLPTSNVEQPKEEGENNRKLKIEDRKIWPALAREAAVALTGIAQENNPIGSLLMDILYCFSMERVERMFSRTLVRKLNYMSGRPWNELTRRKTKEAPQGVTEVWLARVLRSYGVRPCTMRIGEAVAKGYSMEEFTPVFRRYIPRSEVDDMKARLLAKSPEQIEREEAEKELAESRANGLEAIARMNEVARMAKGLRT